MKRLLLSAALLILAGCATPPPLPVGASPHSWNLSGRVALRAGDQGWNAGLLWRQRADYFVLRLEGPLGQGAVELTGAPGRTTLRTAGGKVYHAASPEALLVRVLGVRMPVGGMRYWVRGRPAPGSRAREQRNGSGQLTVLRQEGWVIHYESYAQVQGRSLPVRMRLANGNVRLRLIVDRWENGGVGAESASGR